MPTQMMPRRGAGSSLPRAVVLVTGLALALGACSRFKAPEGTRAPFVEVQLVLASGLPADRVAAMEVVFRGAPGGPALVAAGRGQSLGLGLDSNGNQYVSQLRPEPGDPTRYQVVVSYASNPFSESNRTFSIFAYPPGADAGTIPPMVVSATLYTTSGRSLAVGQTSVDLAGQPIQFGTQDQTAQVVLACVEGGPCTDPIQPADARITVRRAPGCPATTTGFRGKLYAILFPTGPNPGQGELYGVQENVDFTDSATIAVVSVNAPPGSYLMMAILDVGNDLPIANLSPRPGDLSSVAAPLDVFRDRVSERSVVLERVEGVGTCIGGPTLYPPTLTGTLPPSPGNATQIAVTGTAPGGVTIRLYGDATCTGTPAGDAAVAPDGTFVAPLAVIPDSTTTIFATATGADGHVSACSPAGVTYVHDRTPPVLGSSALTVTNTTSSAATLGWSAATDNVSAPSKIRFRIDVCTRPRDVAPCAQALAPTLAGQTSAVVTGLVSDVRYFFYVSPLDEAGNVGAPTQAATALVSAAAPWTAVALGRAHSCGLLPDGRVACWGSNASGQAGGAVGGAATASPRIVAGLTDVSALSTGGDHTCALRGDGALLCWGDNAFGQLGDGTMSSRGSPAPVTGLGAAAVSIGLGDDHSCAVLLDGRVECWGRGDASQLGRGATAASSPFPGFVMQVSQPQPVAASGFGSVIGGGRHTCGLRAGASGLGEMDCWGTNDAQQFGGSFSAGTYGFTQPLSFFGVTNVFAGSDHSCFMNQQGLVCVGKNDNGQLGLGTTSGNFSNTPVGFPNQTHARSALAARNATCAVTTTGDAYCWGQNDRGQAGAEITGRPQTSPNLVTLGRPARALATGGEHACALLSDGALRCWGRNDAGQLGDGTMADSIAAVTVGALAADNRVAALAAGGAHACAVTADGNLACWGANASGQLGRGVASEAGLLPARVPGLAGNVLAVAAGAAFTCVLDATGRPRCFGDGAAGQSGNADLASTTVPTPVFGLVGAKALAAGGGHACILNDFSNVVCWGENNQGQVGGSFGDNAATPRTLQFGTGGPLNARSLSLGEEFSCALNATGDVYCFGTNAHGELDALPAQIPNSIQPRAVSFTAALSGRIVQIAAGARHACARSIDGQIGCWGDNAAGQLGTPGVAPGSPVAPIANLAGATTVVAGDDHTCAAFADGTVQCWGGNAKGQLGLGTTQSSPTPVAVPGLTRVVALTAGTGFTCTLDASGLLACFGDNTSGRIGITASSPALTPTPVSRLP